MKEYIIVGKRTYQTSEDTWERATIDFIGDSNTTLKDISDWVSKNTIDINTIQVVPNTNNHLTQIAQVEP